MLFIGDALYLKPFALQYELFIFKRLMRQILFHAFHNYLSREPSSYPSRYGTFFITFGLNERLKILFATPWIHIAPEY